LAVKIAERFGLLVERQWSAREEGRLARRLKAAQLKLTASVEETDFRTPRGLDRGVFLELAELGFLRSAGNVILTGATGLGKTYLACALADRAAMSTPATDDSRALAMYVIINTRSLLRPE